MRVDVTDHSSTRRYCQSIVAQGEDEESRSAARGGGRPVVEMANRLNAPTDRGPGPGTPGFPRAGDGSGCWRVFRVPNDQEGV
jgi:hypothetical protein